MKTFKELGLNQETMKSLDDLGFTEPTPVQEKVIPFILEKDKDLIALAQTGTGKTAAFGLQRKGEISTPVRTEYGWHIIKKIDQQKIADYALMKDQIRNDICKSDRYRICKQNIIRRIQKNIVVNKRNIGYFAFVFTGNTSDYGRIRLFGADTVEAGDG